jgi:urea carboxylase
MLASKRSSGGSRRGLPGGCFGAFSDVPGNIWKILVGEGACVEASDPVALVESMKMEIAIVAAARGARRRS